MRLYATATTFAVLYSWKYYQNKIICIAWPQGSLQTSEALTCDAPFALVALLVFRKTWLPTYIDLHTSLALFAWTFFCIVLCRKGSHDGLRTLEEAMWICKSSCLCRIQLVLYRLSHIHFMILWLLQFSFVKGPAVMVSKTIVALPFRSCFDEPSLPVCDLSCWHKLCSSPNAALFSCLRICEYRFNKGCPALCLNFANTCRSPDCNTIRRCGGSC